jgi:hypothetical protein
MSTFHLCLDGHLLGDQLLGPVVLPNGLEGVVCLYFFANDFPVLLEHVPLHQQQMWFVHDEAHLTFSALSDRTWTRISVNSGQDREASSTDLHDPMTLITWSFSCGRHVKKLVYSTPINDLEVLQQRVENACQDIRVKPCIFDRLCTSVRRKSPGTPLAGSSVSLNAGLFVCRMAK